MFVPLVNDSFPTGPSPDRESGGKEIIVCYARSNLSLLNPAIMLMRVSCSYLSSISLQNAEERNGRHIVIFQYDTFVRQRECPLLCHVFRWVAAVVLLLVVVVYFAFPVDVCHYFATSFYARHVAFAARAVLIEKSVRGVLSSLVRILAPAVWGG